MLTRCASNNVILDCENKETCHYIFDYNSLAFLVYFILFVPLETRMNTLHYF